MKPLLLVAVAVAIIWFLLQPPSATKLVGETSIDVEQGSITHRGIVYNADWDEVTEHAGDLRYIGRAHDEAAPIITHDATVTTGEFSDPDIVSVTPIRNGSMRWSAKKRPQGTLVVLHFIPTSQTVLDDLERLAEGDHARFIGRKEQDNYVKGDDGRFFGLRHNNHQLFLLEAVKQP